MPSDSSVEEFEKDLERRYQLEREQLAAAEQKRLELEQIEQEQQRRLDLERQENEQNGDEGADEVLGADKAAAKAIAPANDTAVSSRQSPPDHSYAPDARLLSDLIRQNQELQKTLADERISALRKEHQRLTTRLQQYEDQDDRQRECGKPSRRLQMPVLEKFSGREPQTAEDEQPFSTWAKQFEQEMNISLVSHNQWLTTLRYFLSGRAVEVYDSRLSYLPVERRSYEGMVDVLRQTFDYCATEREAQERFLGLNWDRGACSIDVFFSRVERVARTAYPKFDDQSRQALVLRRFVEALPPVIQRQIDTRIDLSPVPDAVQCYQVLDWARQISRQEEKYSKPISDSRSQPEREERASTSFEAARRQWQDDNNVRASAEDSRGGQQQQQRPQRDVTQITCFNCGQQGHYASHCRENLTIKTVRAETGSKVLKIDFNSRFDRKPPTATGTHRGDGPLSVLAGQDEKKKSRRRRRKHRQRRQSGNSQSPDAFRHHRLQLVATGCSADGRSERQTNNVHPPRPTKPSADERVCAQPSAQPPTKKKKDVATSEAKASATGTRAGQRIPPWLLPMALFLPLLLLMPTLSVGQPMCVSWTNEEAMQLPVSGRHMPAGPPLTRRGVGRGLLGTLSQEPRRKPPSSTIYALTVAAVTAHAPGAPDGTRDSCECNPLGSFLRSTPMTDAERTQRRDSSERRRRLTPPPLCGSSPLPKGPIMQRQRSVSREAVPSQSPSGTTQTRSDTPPTAFEPKRTERRPSERRETENAWRYIDTAQRLVAADARVCADSSGRRMAEANRHHERVQTTVLRWDCRTDGTNTGKLTFTFIHWRLREPYDRVYSVFVDRAVFRDDRPCDRRDVRPCDRRDVCACDRQIERPCVVTTSLWLDHSARSNELRPVGLIAASRWSDISTTTELEL